MAAQPGRPVFLYTFQRMITMSTTSASHNVLNKIISEVLMLDELFSSKTVVKYDGSLYVCANDNKLTALPSLTSELNVHLHSTPPVVKIKVFYALYEAVMMTV